MSKLKEIWEVIKLHKKSNHPKVPTISKNLPIIKWTENFTEHWNQCVGFFHVPLANMICKDAAVSEPCPPLETYQPYSEETNYVN